MPTNVTMTEKEVVLLQRAAFDRGARHALAYQHDDIAAASLSFYPLPKTTRVVYETGMLANAWRYVDGGLQMLPYGAARKEERHWLRWADCRQSSDFAPVPGRVALWADLIANPTEEVEGES